MNSGSRGQPRNVDVLAKEIYDKSTTIYPKSTINQSADPVYTQQPPPPVIKCLPHGVFPKSHSQPDTAVPKRIPQNSASSDESVLSFNRFDFGFKLEPSLLRKTITSSLVDDAGDEEKVPQIPVTESSAELDITSAELVEIETVRKNKKTKPRRKPKKISDTLNISVGQKDLSDLPEVLTWPADLIYLAKIFVELPKYEKSQLIMDSAVALCDFCDKFDINFKMLGIKDLNLEKLSHIVKKIKSSHDNKNCLTVADEKTLKAMGASIKKVLEKLQTREYQKSIMASLLELKNTVTDRAICQKSVDEFFACVSADPEIVKILSKLDTVKMNQKSVFEFVKNNIAIFSDLDEEKSVNIDIDVEAGKFSVYFLLNNGSYSKEIEGKDDVYSASAKLIENLNVEINNMENERLDFIKDIENLETLFKYKDIYEIELLKLCHCFNFYVLNEFDILSKIKINNFIEMYNKNEGYIKDGYSKLEYEVEEFRDKWRIMAMEIYNSNNDVPLTEEQTKGSWMDHVGERANSTSEAKKKFHNFGKELAAYKGFRVLAINSPDEKIDANDCLKLQKKHLPELENRLESIKNKRQDAFDQAHCRMEQGAMLELLAVLIPNAIRLKYEEGCKNINQTNTEIEAGCSRKLNR